MADLRRSELMLMLRNGLARRHSKIGAPFCERQVHDALSPVDHNWDIRAPGDRADPHRIHLNTQLAWRHDGPVNHDALERAAREVVRRHSILGCRLRHEGMQRRFVTGAAPPLSLQRLRAADGTSSAIARTLQPVAWQPFSWDTEGPVRLACVEITDTDQVIAVTTHHAVTDSYSARIFSHDLFAFYDAFCRNESPSLPPLPLQYLDYMVSIDKWSREPQAQQYLSYWATYMEGARGLDAARGSDVAFRMFRLPAEVSETARELCRKECVGPDLFWEAIHHAALARLLDRTDVVSASIDVGRRQRELVGLMGCFMNVLPTRSHVRPDSTFRQLLREMFVTRRASVPYRAAPFWLIAGQCSFNFPVEIGALNFIPREFQAIDTFGPLVRLPVPPFGPGPRYPYPYGIIVLDGPELTVSVMGAILQPFAIPALAEALASTARAAVRAPDAPLHSLPAA